MLSEVSCITAIENDDEKQFCATSHPVWAKAFNSCVCDNIEEITEIQESPAELKQLQQDFGIYAFFAFSSYETTRSQLEFMNHISFEDESRLQTKMHTVCLVKKTQNYNINWKMHFRIQRSGQEAGITVP